MDQINTHGVMRLKDALADQYVKGNKELEGIFIDCFEERGFDECDTAYLQARCVSKKLDYPREF